MDTVFLTFTTVYWSWQYLGTV